MYKLEIKVGIESKFSLITIIVLLLTFDLSAQVEVKAEFFVKGDGKILIEYELKNVNNNSEYEVEVHCRRVSDKSFLLIPKNLTGDIGKLSSVFGKKKIVWEMTKEEKDYLEKLNANDIYFEVFANVSKSWFENLKWYHYTGVAVVVGVLSWIIAKSLETKTTDKTIVGAPPTRP